MNSQYLEHFDVEFLDSNVKLKKVVLIVEENNTEKSSSYCKTRENSNFLKKGKTVISVKIRNFF